ncbi:MAG: hypothetical protein IKT83_00510 [Bacteroidaceae bacterium]|nr:hypothetical protein [Bacteroidaceae bacterium]
MMRRLLLFLPLLCTMWLTIACDEKNIDSNLSSGTSLCVSFRSERALPETRGIEDLDDDGTVSELEEIVDGRRMYRLAVFLVSDNNVVASAVLMDGDSRFSNENTEATVTFEDLDYSKSYQLYAVANYGNTDSGANGHLSSFTNPTVQTNVTASSASKLCNSKTPYPLSLKKDIVLQPGVNTVYGELTRTYARMRINIRNQSNYNLKVTQLDFADKFTQSTADLFQPGGTANAKPDATSADAVTPFVPNTIIPMFEAAGKVSEATVFDGYMLESNGGNYSYTLGLEYSDGEAEKNYEVSSNYINTTAGIQDGELYVIYSTNTRKYLYANGTSSVALGESFYSTGEQLNHNYVWRLKKVSGNNYNIESLGASGYYMKGSGLTSSTLPLTSAAAASDYFTVSQNSSYLVFKSTTSRGYYISASGNNVLGSTSTTGNGRRFRLFKVTTTNDIVTHKETIPIKTIDNTTGEAIPMQRINRNDFINILVNVSYNDNVGKLEFEVSDWDEVKGDVTFE